MIAFVLALLIEVSTATSNAGATNASLAISPADVPMPIARAVRIFGTPSAAVTRDDGSHFIFSVNSVTIDAIVDGEDQVHGLDVNAGAVRSSTTPPAVASTVDGTARTFAFGAYTEAQADADLASVADFALDHARTYRLAPTRELYLGFDPATHTLNRFVLGDRGALARLGLLPSDLTAKQFPYVAAVLRTSAINGNAGGTHATVLRLDIDPRGVVRNVAIAVPSSDATFDAALLKKVGDDHYSPAKLNGRTIGSTVYREIWH